MIMIDACTSVVKITRTCKFESEFEVKVGKNATFDGVSQQNFGNGLEATASMVPQNVKVGSAQMYIYCSFSALQ